jgi:hypothetical protein
MTIRGKVIPLQRRRPARRSGLQVGPGGGVLRTLAHRANVSATMIGPRTVNTTLAMAYGDAQDRGLTLRDLAGAGHGGVDGHCPGESATSDDRVHVQNAMRKQRAVRLTNPTSGPMLPWAHAARFGATPMRLASASARTSFNPSAAS